MKVTIDRDGCIECGACEQACSEVFIVKGGEKASIVSKYQKNSPSIGDVPEDFVACAEDAVSSCPVQVITMG